MEPPQEVGPARTWWIWAGISSARTSLQPGGTTLGAAWSAGPGATAKACGVVVDEAAGEKLGTDPVERSVVNVGTILGVALPAGQPGRSGKARRRLMARGWGGVLVVVRGRESRPHGEGGQRVRSRGTGMPGGRR